MLVSTVFCSCYPYFQENIENYISDSAQTEPENISFVIDEDYQRYMLSTIYYLNYETTPDMDAYAYFTQNCDLSKYDKIEQDYLKKTSSRLMKNMYEQYYVNEEMWGCKSYAVSASKSYGGDSYLKYAIYGDDVSSSYASGIVITYDSMGNPSIGSNWNIEYTDSELLNYLRTANMRTLMLNNGIYENLEELATSDIEISIDAETDMDVIGMVTTAPVPTEPLETPETPETPEDMPSEVISEGELENGIILLERVQTPVIQNASFVFGILNEEEDPYWSQYYLQIDAVNHSGLKAGLMAMICLMFVFAVVLQNISALGLSKHRLFRFPTEILAIIGSVFAVYSVIVVDEFSEYTINGNFLRDLTTIGVPKSGYYFVLWLCWTVFLLGCYWLFASVLPYITHPILTLREHTLFFSFCRWLKKTWLRFYHWATDIQLKENLTNHIWKLVLFNGVIAGILCMGWIGGVLGVVLYSVILYVLIKRKCSQILEDYQKLLSMTRTLAEGNLNISEEDEMGFFNTIRDEIISIRNGLKKAVEEEVKSQNMKTELITNVSHDLKTPLTAIITYVDLLKKEDLTEEERKEYIETLDKKSQRLKALIEDLFEVSKASSHNIVMNFTKVDLVNLIKQVKLENEDKILSSELDIRWNLPEEKCYLSLDPQRTYRIIDNLLQNILKYSMPKSRVYIDLKAEGEEVLVSFKNMSAVEMNFSANEITERFVRGDLSRNTEGSGLGLAIAQSFTELQNGTFKVEIDGDLFKVLLCWKKTEI